MRDRVHQLKIAVMALILAVSGGQSLVAQEAPAEPEVTITISEPPPQENKAAIESMGYQAEVLSRLFGVPVQVEGALPMALRVDKPYQLINPFAPEKYGDGYKNLSIDPKTKNARGIKVFSVGF